jgi:7-cyano-7-deazaguanine synthase
MLLLSGGIDSLALAYWVKPSHALTVDYGQRPAAKECSVATHVARAWGIEHQTLQTRLQGVGAGTLAGTSVLPEAPTPEWWPFRNQLLITVAAMAAIKAGIREILIGTVCSDAQHADGRAAFLSAMQELLRCQEGGIKISAPALHLTSEELVRISAIPRESLACAHSCHVGAFACNRCRGCLKHATIFEQFGLT